VAKIVFFSFKAQFIIRKNFHFQQTPL